MSELTFIPNPGAKCVSDDDVASKVSDEERLMARLATGEEEPLKELIAIHGEMLARLVGRLTAWHADSDDVLQEVLLVVWKSVPRDAPQLSTMVKHQRC